jgi:hypothetical protein
MTPPNKEEVVTAFFMMVAFIGLLILFTGCATTRLSVRLPDGAAVEFTFPKNLAAEDLHIKAGDYSLTAKTLRTDASTVIGSKAVVVTAAGDAAAKIVPAVVGGLAP